MDDKVEQAFAAYQSAVKGLKDGVDEQCSTLEQHVLALTTEVRQLASEVKILRKSFQALSDDMISGAILPARGSPSGSLRRSTSTPRIQTPVAGRASSFQ